MYGVSDAYKNAIKAADREMFYDIEITANDGKKLTIPEVNILKGSASITSQCGGNEEIELGSVYTSEFDVTLLIPTDRYTLMNGEIRPYYNLRLADGSLERLPMGVYDISEAYRRVSGVEITAYDHMARFEMEFLAGQTAGKPYDFLMITSTACGVLLGNTQEEIEAMPNGGETLTLSQDNDIETWRDLLHYLSQILSGFATIDRSGALVIRQYGAAPVKNISNKQRFNSNFADYVTRYTGLRHQNMKKGVVDYVHSEPDNGLTMDLGANPFMQSGADSLREKRLTAILGGIRNINYIPFESSAIEDPSLELGDVLTFSGGHADETGISAITHINLQFNGGQELKCVGKNPRLMNAKSKTDKQLASLQNSATENVLALYSYTNAQQIKIGQNRTEVVSIQYVTTKSTNAEFKGVVLLNVAAAGTLSVIYVSSDNEITDFVPMQILTPGRHIVNLYYPLAELAENKVGVFRVLLLMDTGSATVDRGGVKATIVGQGFAAAGNEWDGRLEFKEEFSRIQFPASEFTVRTFTDEVTVKYPVRTGSEITDTFGRIVFGQQTFTVRALTERLASEVTIKSFTLDEARPGAYDDRYVLVDGDGRFVLNQTYTFRSAEKPIDKGRMCEVVIDTEPFETVARIEVK